MSGWMSGGLEREIHLTFFRSLDFNNLFFWGGVAFACVGNKSTIVCEVKKRDRERERERGREGERERKQSGK